jgi:hypothetical protein
VRREAVPRGKGDYISGSTRERDPFERKERRKAKTALPKQSGFVVREK